MESKWDKALRRVIWHEGGYGNDPDDGGGETKYGISKAAYPGLDIKNLTLAQAVEIYRRDYWIRPKIDWIVDHDLAAKVFDIAVNVGPGRAVKFLQGACNLFGAGLQVDGNLGPATAAWVNQFRHPKALISAFEILAGNYYIRLNQRKFLAGWLIRLNE